MSHKPLLAWDAPDPKASTLLAVSGGSLFLDNLEFVVKWTGNQGAEPATFLQVTGGDFGARNCTFSAAGRHPKGFLLARLDAGMEAHRCRLTNCYARGLQLMMLSLRGPIEDAPEPYRVDNPVDRQIAGDGQLAAVDGGRDADGRYQR